MIEITAEYLASQGFSKTLPERFWAKVKKTESCWLWTGALSGGYGNINPRGWKAGAVKAHRVSWILNVGPIPDGLWVLHNCPIKHNRACVNPAHLKLGDAQENRDDCIKAGTAVYVRFHGEDHGNSKLTWDEVDRIRSMRGLCKDIAPIFGVCKEHIAAIRRGKGWDPKFHP
jgi:hypothetical protein